MSCTHSSHKLETAYRYANLLKTHLQPRLSKRYVWVVPNRTSLVSDASVLRRIDRKTAQCRICMTCPPNHASVIMGIARKCSEASSETWLLKAISVRAETVYTKNDRAHQVFNCMMRVCVWAIASVLTLSSSSALIFLSNKTLNASS